METNASMLAAFGLGTTGSIIQFIIGLGLMVFVHELGHFLAAKAVGIKVERFALGFGPRLLGIQWGETDYCLNALPLGGYIKMLGQEDFAPLKDEKKIDPRSYNAKTVGQRMIVISAGVVMNAIMALIMFVIIARIGYDFKAPQIGDVVPHSPAATAKITWANGLGAATQPATKPTTQPVTTTGIEEGDRIVRVDGSGLMLSIIGPEINRFDHIAYISAMSDREDQYKFTIEREVDGNTWTGTALVGVRMNDGKLTFGLGPARDTVVVMENKDIVRSPDAAFQDGDRVIAVAGKKIEHYWDIQPALRNAKGLTVPVTVQRDGKKVSLTAPRVLTQNPRVAYLPDGTKLNLEDYDIELQDANFVLTSLVSDSKLNIAKDDLKIVAAEQILDILGMTPREAIGAVQKDTPAAKAGLKPGDVIVHYADTHLPAHKQVREINKNALKDGKTHLSMSVERDGNELPPFQIKPVSRKGGAIVGFMATPDLAHAIVAYVRPDSIAARANIESGSVIAKINGRDVTNWAQIFDALQDFSGQDLTLTLRRSSRPDAESYEAKISADDAAAFDTEDYHLSLFANQTEGFLRPIFTTIRKDGFGEAFVWSLREAGGFMISTYISLRSLVLGNVSAKQFVGPLGMGGIAVAMAEQGFMHFFYFMAIVSTILAVMNFLPLPVVDGGHAVFLIIEKIRGKPLPVKVLNITQLIGLVALGLVFLALTYQDIMRLFG